VIEAARLCDQAGSGNTLVSPLVRSAIGDRDGFEFVDVGPLTLKGIASTMIAGRLAVWPSGRLAVWPSGRAVATRERGRCG